jgi:cyclopropane fatty-acyl-phospholipid synthase-like methyltransferase
MKSREHEVVDNIIKSYSENIGFIVYTADELRAIFKALGIDPSSTHRSIFDLESMSHHLQSEVLKLIKLIGITENDLVLDAGCGNGAPTRLIAKTCGCKIIGVDVNPHQISKADECNRLEGVNHLIDLSIKDIHKLDFTKDSFDKIFHNETMCHWANKTIALAGLFNVIKHGGIMGFHDWLRGDKGDLNNAGGNFPGTYADGIWFQHTLEETNILLQEAGFVVLKAQDTTDIVDRGLRAKLREVQMSKDYYLKSGLQEYYGKSIRYCQTMIETHYDFLKYGRFVCIKN